MVPTLRQYEQVRLRQLLRPPEAYDGWALNQRPPQVGDVGCLVDILQAAGVTNSYVVEFSGPDGVIVWMGDFSTSELEPVG